MACDGCAVLLANRYNAFHLLIVVQLAFVLFGSSPVAAESGLSYHGYEVSPEDLPTSGAAFTFRSDGFNDDKSSRKRRYSGREEPPEDRTKEETTVEQPVIKAETSSANVAYSTAKLPTLSGNATIAAAAAAPLTTSTTTLKPIAGKPNVTETTVATPKPDSSEPTKSTMVIVSKPMHPPSEQPIHVWANQTRWDNATRKSLTESEASTEAPRINVKDPPKPDRVNEHDDGAVDTGSGKNSSVQSTNSTDGELGDTTITKFSDVTNNTLAQNNITKTEEDTHQYYNSTFFSDENIAKMYWVDMDNHPDRKVNDLLSKSHRRAATVKLKFDFPFYGHKVRNITIATGGFLYTGEYVHSWLAATQYIAPLMANFDTRLSSDSWVKYADNGTAFTVEWERVVLQDRPAAGGFTFQATLHSNGNIVFVYSKIPLTVEDIEDTAHPVKVGLSDAYIMDRTIFFVRRKTIYEYHRVNFNRQEIRNWTVIYLRALPTCLEMDNCNDCLTKVPEFECKWCPDLQQCSTGTFRFRQDWLEKGCEQRNIKEKNSCPATKAANVDHAEKDDPGHVQGDVTPSVVANENTKAASGASISEHAANRMTMGVSGIIGILMVVSLLAGLAAWAGYAYRNPHSASGQMLIRYRPSQWSWRRGEARYTAATIHM